MSVHDHSLSSDITRILERECAGREGDALWSGLFSSSPLTDDAVSTPPSDLQFEIRRPASTNIVGSSLSPLPSPPLPFHLDAVVAENEAEENSFLSDPPAAEVIARGLHQNFTQGNTSFHGAPGFPVQYVNYRGLAAAPFLPHCPLCEHNYFRLRDLERAVQRLDTIVIALQDGQRKDRDLRTVSRIALKCIADSLDNLATEME